MHKEQSPSAGKTVKIKPDAKHPYIPTFGGSSFKVEDWQDRIMGMSWTKYIDHPVCIEYSLRISEANILVDDEVLYGKIGLIFLLVHVSEIESDISPLSNLVHLVTP